MTIILKRNRNTNKAKDLKDAHTGDNFSPRALSSQTLQNLADSGKFENYSFNKGFYFPWIF